MSIKKILAAAVASIMAVSTMAVTAFAGTGDIPGSDTSDRMFEYKGKDKIAEFLEGNKPEDLESITFKGDATFTIAYDKTGEGWYQSDEGAKDEWTIPASDFDWAKEDQCIKFCAYHSDASADPITITWTFNKKAASTEAASTTAASTEAASTTAAPADSNTAPSDKGNADTGIEGVAVVASLAVLAAGAIVVAKKRK